MTRLGYCRLEIPDTNRRLYFFSRYVSPFNTLLLVEALSV